MDSANYATSGEDEQQQSPPEPSQQPTEDTKKPDKIGSWSYDMVRSKNESDAPDTRSDQPAQPPGGETGQ